MDPTDGSDTIETHAVAIRREEGGTQTLTYRNSYQPAAGWHRANVFLRSEKGRQDWAD
jgi:hypothetical protein